MVKSLAMMCKLVVMELLCPLEVTEPSSQLKRIPADRNFNSGMTYNPFSNLLKLLLKVGSIELYIQCCRLLDFGRKS